jgi:glycosyltransferase involved in cell wall biosynthesis
VDGRSRPPVSDVRSVLLVQPSLQPPGGGNGVAAWMLQALAGVHRVSVLSWTPVDVGPINRFFGTSLTPSSFDTLVVPRSWRLLPDAAPLPLALVRSALLMRYARRVSGGFDVLIGVHNEVDYGRRGIQYVHYPTYIRPRPEVDFRWYHRVRPLLAAYYRMADALGGFSLARMKENLTLTNSRWTAARIHDVLGISARVLYPPVIGAPAPQPWEARQNGFLAIGRISPEKEYERLIHILSIVRAAGHEITLTLVGTWDRKVRGYRARLQQRAREAGPWVRFLQNVSREELQHLMASHRYGIHGMREEHFGMAPAEMAASGMIVWVPAGGGQMEIVGDEPALLYASDQEAVARITHVLSHPSEQDRLRGHLRARVASFDTARFVDELRGIVAAWPAA